MTNLWIYPHCILPTPGAIVDFETADGQIHRGEYWGGFFTVSPWTRHRAVKWRRATC